MNKDHTADKAESPASAGSKNLFDGDPSRVIAGWMLVCFALVAVLLAYVSSAAYKSLFGLLNPNVTAGLVAWMSGLLLMWFCLGLLLRLSTRLFGSVGQSIFQVALLTLGYAVLFILLLPSAVRLNVILDALPGPLVVGRSAAFVLAALVLSTFVWLAQSLLTRTNVTKGESKLGAIPIGFALVALYYLVLSQWLPSGVSAVFTDKSWLPLLLISLLLHFAIALLYGRTKSRFGWNLDGVQWRWSDAAFVIVPLTPVASYMIVNRGYLTPVTAAVLLAVMLIAIYIFVVAVPRVLAASCDPRVVMAIAAGGAFTLTVMPALSRSQAWFEVGSWTYQMITLVAAVSILLAFTLPQPKVLLAAAVIFATLQISLAGVDPQSDVEYLDETTMANSSTIETGEWEEALDIVVLIYESYANTETMEAYGIDNTEQIEFLSEQGFTIYDGTYSNGSHSTESMSRFLNASSGLVSTDERRYTAGYAQVPQLLSEKGYTSAGIFPSDYYFGIHEPLWDSFVPEMTTGTVDSLIPLVKGVARGEFRSDASFNSIDYDIYLESKRQLMEQDGNSPLFLHTHNKFPGHSQNSGQCLPDETDRYIEGLDIANQEMRVDVETVLSSRPNAVVVIAGDHGPYLTKNCAGLANYESVEIDRLDIQDRYGTFLAIHWPDGSVPDYDIEVLQEVLPAVLANVSGDEAYWNERVVKTSTLGFAAGPVRVEQGQIVGGKNDGQPLFLQRRRS